ncbi:MAG: trigger factor [Nitrospirae bacterium]|nr:trigger factor [Nitrospirota bacterium]
MKLDVEDLGATKKRLKVEIPADAIKAAIEEAYKEVGKTAKVDGFRPGKAPRHILVKYYSDSVEANVIERIVPEYYGKALDEADLTPIDRPHIEEGSLKIKKDQPLTFTATVEVKPVIVLGEYKGITVKDEPLEVSDSDMDEALAELRSMHSTLETVEEDRASVKGDFVVIDFEGFKDGEPIQGGKAENYPLELGSSSMIPGFEENLEGAKKGETREFTVRFPEEYRNKDLAGAEATFKAAVKELKSKVLPELDDELAKDLGIGQTLAELKDKVREDILMMKKRGVAQKQKEEIVRELVRLHDFELPPTLVEKEFRSMMVRRYQEVVGNGMPTGKASEELKEFEPRAKAIAQDRVKTTLVLSAIADKEGIKVTEKEMEAGIRMIAAETGHTPQQVMEMYKKREGGLEDLAAMIGEDKSLDFVLSHAKKA